MTDFTKTLATLRRPQLLVRAALHGLLDYDRNRDLQRLLPETRMPSPAEAMQRLLDSEAQLESARRDGTATYSVARHVDVMIALLCEMRLINRSAA